MLAGLAALAACLPFEPWTPIPEERDAALLCTGAITVNRPPPRALALQEGWPENFEGFVGAETAEHLAVDGGFVGRAELSGETPLELHWYRWTTALREAGWFSVHHYGGRTYGGEGHTPGASRWGVWCLDSCEKHTLHVEMVERDAAALEDAANTKGEEQRLPRITAAVQLVPGRQPAPQVAPAGACEPITGQLYDVPMCETGLFAQIGPARRLDLDGDDVLDVAIPRALEEPRCPGDFEHDLFVARGDCGVWVGSVRGEPTSESPSRNHGLYPWAELVTVDERGVVRRYGFDGIEYSVISVTGEASAAAAPRCGPALPVKPDP